MLLYTLYSRLVIVVDRLLTGFDAPCLSTLFIDRQPMSSHDIVQAFSRSNRIFDKNKRYGQIVTFQSPKKFKKAVDDAIKLFSAGGTGEALTQDWEEVETAFVVALVEMRGVAEVPDVVPTLTKKQKKLFAVKFQRFDSLLLNDYALYHERQTTMDFHHQLKGAILDAVDEGLIDRDPTRKAIIKGKTPREKKLKYLNQFELHTLLSNLDLKGELNWDWFILLVAKTGMRFSEALAITPKDFDFAHQSLSISKTWDYKGKGGFLPTKNRSSVRKLQIDWQLVIQFSELIKGLPEDAPIFVKGEVYNSTVNDILARHCKKSKIPVISVHGLRHTHASLLLFAGVSIASVARRLGHASMTTTQKTYLHIIQELENKDVDLVMRSLSSLS